MRMQDLIDDFLGFIRQSKLIRKIFGSIYHAFHHDNTIVKVDELRADFQKNGLKVLEFFDSVMTRNGYKYSLAFGTMLGAVREKGFIKHDADIDVFMWIEDYSQFFLDCLLKNGFTISHTFTVENDKYAKELTIMLDGVQIDIFFIYPPLDGRVYPYCCDFVVHSDCLSREHSVRKHGGLLPRRLEMPMSRDVVRVPFESLSLPILTNAHEYLGFRYGKDYMIPNPGWVSGENPHIIPWQGKVAVFS